MKKIWGILIVGLLLVGCTMSTYETWDTKELELSLFSMPNSMGKKTFPEIKLKADEKCQSLNRGNSINLKEIYSNWQKDHFRYSFDCDVRKEIVEKKRIEKEEKMKAELKMIKEKKEQMKITSMVDDAKSACKDIGHEEGTDRFEDCSLDLYKQSLALAAEKNQQIIYAGSSSLGSSSVTIYDPVRDNNALIKRGQGLINGTCTLGDLSNC